MLVDASFQILKPHIGRGIVIDQVLCKVLFYVLAHKCVLGSDDVAFVSSILRKEGLGQSECSSRALPFLANLIPLVLPLAHPCMLLGEVSSQTLLVLVRSLANGACEKLTGRRLSNFLLINCNSHCLDLGYGVKSAGGC